MPLRRHGLILRIIVLAPRGVKSNRYNAAMRPAASLPKSACRVRALQGMPPRRLCIVLSP
eukprot:scaffold130400_cov63-Phaeocystis_antarctica.AAC.3